MDSGDGMTPTGSTGISTSAVSRMLTQAGFRKQTSDTQRTGFQCDRRPTGEVTVWFAGGPAEAVAAQDVLERRYVTDRPSPTAVAIRGKR